MSAGLLKHAIQALSRSGDGNESDAWSRETKRAAEKISDAAVQATRSTTALASLEDVFEAVLHALGNALASAAASTSGLPDVENATCTTTWSAMARAARRMLGVYRNSMSQTTKQRLRRCVGQFCAKTAPTCVARVDSGARAGDATMRPALMLLSSLVRTSPQSLRQLEAKIQHVLTVVLSRRTEKERRQRGQREGGAGGSAEPKRIAARALAATAACPQDRAAAWSSLLRRALLQLHSLLDVMRSVADARAESAHVRRLGSEAKKLLVPAGAEPPQALFGGADESDGIASSILCARDAVHMFASSSLVVEELFAADIGGAVPLSSTAVLALVKRVMVMGVEGPGRRPERATENTNCTLGMQIAALSILQHFMSACGNGPLLSHASEIASILDVALELTDVSEVVAHASEDVVASHRILSFSMCAIFLDTFRGGGALALVNILVPRAVRSLDALARAMHATSGTESAERVAMAAAIEEVTRGSGSRRGGGRKYAKGSDPASNLLWSTYELNARLQVGMSALNALKSLLDAGGELLPPEIRTRVDSCVISVEAALRAAGASAVHAHIPIEMENTVRAALLMSVLVPSSARPGGLPHALRCLAAMRTPSSFASPSAPGMGSGTHLDGSVHAWSIAAEASLHPAVPAILPAYTEAPFNADYFDADVLQRMATEDARALVTTTITDTATDVRANGSKGVDAHFLVPHSSTKRKHDDVREQRRDGEDHALRKRAIPAPSVDVASKIAAAGDSATHNSETEKAKGDDMPADRNGGSDEGIANNVVAVEEREQSPVLPMAREKEKEDSGIKADNVNPTSSKAVSMIREEVVPSDVVVVPEPARQSPAGDANDDFLSDSDGPLPELVLPMSDSEDSGAS